MNIFRKIKLWIIPKLWIKKKLNTLHFVIKKDNEDYKLYQEYKYEYRFDIMPTYYSLEAYNEDNDFRWNTFPYSSKRFKDILYQIRTITRYYEYYQYNIMINSYCWRFGIVSDNYIIREINKQFPEFIEIDEDE